jgi:hypothetical protein
VGEGQIAFARMLRASLLLRSNRCGRGSSCARAHSGARFKSCDMTEEGGDLANESGDLPVKGRNVDSGGGGHGIYCNGKGGPVD